MKTRILDLIAALITKVLPILLLAVVIHELRALLITATRHETVLPAWVELMSGLKRARGFAFVLGFAGVLYGFQQHRVRAAWEARYRARLGESEHAPDTTGKV